MKRVEEKKLVNEPLDFSKHNQRTFSSMETVDPLEVAKWDFD
jgi:hypothetical protein